MLVVGKNDQKIFITVYECNGQIIGRAFRGRVNQLYSIALYSSTVELEFSEVFWLNRGFLLIFLFSNGVRRSNLYKTSLYKKPKKFEKGKNGRPRG